MAMFRWTSRECVKREWGVERMFKSYTFLSALCLSCVAGGSAGAVPASDEVFLNIIGGQVPNGGVRIKLSSITEGDEAGGKPIVVQVPGVVINFTDPVEPPGTSPPVSDALVVAPFTVTINSDTNPTGFPPRQGAFQVSEKQLIGPFVPLIITIVSDANEEPPAANSDRLTVQVIGTQGLNVPLTEATENEPVAVPFLGKAFDIKEDDVVSDQVDLGAISLIGFASDLNPPDLTGLIGPLTLNVPEKTGPNAITEVMYRLEITSDVPEPSALALFGVGAVGLLIRCRTSVRRQF